MPPKRDRNHNRQKNDNASLLLYVGRTGCAKGVTPTWVESGDLLMIDEALGCAVRGPLWKIAPDDREGRQLAALEIGAGLLGPFGKAFDAGNVLLLGFRSIFGSQPCTPRHRNCLGAMFKTSTLGLLVSAMLTGVDKGKSNCRRTHYFDRRLKSVAWVVRTPIEHEYRHCWLDNDHVLVAQGDFNDRQANPISMDSPTIGNAELRNAACKMLEKRDSPRLPIITKLFRQPSF